MQYACNLARLTDATVHVLAVAPIGESPMQFSSDVVTDIHQATTTIADHISTIENADSVDLVTSVRRGRPHKQIIDYATDVDASVIVIGKTGADGTVEAFLGSTTRRVLRNAECPVTVVG